MTNTFGSSNFQVLRMDAMPRPQNKVGLYARSTVVPHRRTQGDSLIRLNIQIHQPAKRSN